MKKHKFLKSEYVHKSKMKSAFLAGDLNWMKSKLSQLKSYYPLAIIALLIVGIFLMSSTLAGGDDKTNKTIEKSYDKSIKSDMSDFVKQDFNDKYGVITLTDKKIKDGKEVGKIAETSLATNTELCMVNCKQHYKMTLYENGTLFDSVEYNIIKGKNEQVKNKNASLKLGTEDYFIDINDYELVCKDVIANETTLNQTEGDTVKECSQKIIGTHKEQRIRDVYSEYHAGETKEGNSND